MTVTGGLWEAGLRDGRTPVWLLEWRLRLQLPRRVLIAVDRSDSCESELGLVRECFRVLGTVLRAGDSCAVWIMGSRDPVWQAEIGIDSGGLTEAFDACREGVRGGTWLKTTLDAMRLAEAECPPGQRCLLLIVSDGEVFDVDFEGGYDFEPSTGAVRQSDLAGVGFVHLGNRESGPDRYLRQFARLLAPTDNSLRAFLASERPRVELKYTWEGSRAVCFSASGELLEVDPAANGGTGEGLRVAFVGGATPVIRVAYTLGSAVWTDADLPVAPLPDEGFEHLRLVLSRLAGDGLGWDEDRLRTLAAGAPAEFPCPRVGCKLIGSTAQSLFCRCRALLVSRDGVRREGLPAAYKRSARFEIRPDGSLGPAQPHDSVRDTRPFSIEHADSAAWLVLNLFRT